MLTFAIGLWWDKFSIRFGRYEYRINARWWWGDGIHRTKFRGIEMMALDHRCKPKWVRRHKVILA